MKVPQDRTKNSDQKVKWFIGHFASYRRGGKAVGGMHPGNKVGPSKNGIYRDPKDESDRPWGTGGHQWRIVCVSRKERVS